MVGDALSEPDVCGGTGPILRDLGTWNDAGRIAAHRDMTPSQRIQLAIEVSRAALAFADGERVPTEDR